MSNEDWRELDESYRSALSGALQTARPSVEQEGGDERAKFEYWASDEGIYPKAVERSGNCYKLAQTQSYWMAWQARAALAQPSPVLPPFAEKVLAKLRRFYDCASDFESGGVDIGRHWLDLLTQLGLLNRIQRSPALWEISQQGEDLLGAPQHFPEQAEADRPEVAEVAFVLRNIGAMDAEDIDGDNVDLRFEDAEGRDTGCDVSIVEYAEKAADLFEQHDRIVGALRADRDSWAEQAEQRLADWDEMRKERDAALAEVERLRESKGDPVGSLEKCMKVMYERDEHAKRLEVALARVAEMEKELAMARDAAAKGDAARHQCGGMEMEIEELRAELAELRARVVVVPERLTNGDSISRMLREIGCDGDVSYHHAREIWNACIDELSRINGKTVSEGLLRRLARPADRYDEVFTLDRHEAAEELRALLSEQA
ncbi:hypothetical protein [Pseudomonas aeruginosa]|uniref:hypothetical protein n=1 Tax=Pseudomonas aeruginosa TaxID=287 RepID=UPI001C121F62|nr:hypothetical protein [Pseudomonas aeruginosa]